MAHRFKKPPVRKQRLVRGATARREKFSVILLLALFVALAPLISVRLGLRLLASEPVSVRWVGGVSGDWKNRKNWLPEEVPTETTDVTIGISPKPPVLDRSRVMNSLTVRQGALLVLNGKNLTVRGRLANQGTIRIQCKERVEATVWETGGTWEFVGFPSVAPALCPIDGRHPYDNIVVDADEKSVHAVFTATGADLSVKGKLTIRRGIVETRGRNISVGTMYNEAEFRMRGDETVTIDTFDVAGLGGNGKWMIAGNENGRADTITLKTRRFVNVVLDPGDAGEKFVVANGASVKGAITIEGGTLTVQAAATLSGGTMQIKGGTLKADGSVTLGGRLRIEKGEFIASGRGEQQVGELTIAGGTFRGEGSTGVLRVRQSLYLLSGSLRLPSTFAVGGNLFFGKGTFEAGLGTTVLEGRQQSIFGTPVFQSLKKVATSDDTLSLQPGTLLTVKGTLTLQGGARATLNLRSQSSGKQWILDAPGKKTLNHLNVTDGKNAGAKLFTCSACKDGGNNTGWTFTP